MRDVIEYLGTFLQELFKPTHAAKARTEVTGLDPTRSVEHHARVAHMAGQK